MLEVQSSGQLLFMYLWGSWEVALPPWRLVQLIQAVKTFWRSGSFLLQTFRNQWETSFTLCLVFRCQWLESHRGSAVLTLGDVIGSVWPSCDGGWAHAQCGLVSNVVLLFSFLILLTCQSLVILLYCPLINLLLYFIYFLCVVGGTHVEI